MLGLLWALGNTIPFPAVLPCTIAQEGEEAGQQDRITVDGVEYRLVLDALGVVLRPGAGHKETVLSALEATGEDYRGGLLKAQIGQRTREQLSQVARSIERALPQSVAAAGLLLIKEGDPIPDILGKRFVVIAQQEPDHARLRDQIEALGGLVVRRRNWDQQQYVVDARDTDAQALAHEILGLPDVLRVEVNTLALTEDQSVDDPLLSDQWHHDNRGSLGGAEDADVDSLRAWSLEQGSADVVIAVMEITGFDITHSDLDGNFDLGLSFDDSGWGGGAHGTAVAGLAAAERANGEGGCGTCPSCRLLLLRHTVNIPDQVDAFHYAIDKKVDVLNLSLSYPEGVPPEVASAIEQAAQAGIVVVAAMTNSPIIDESSYASLASHSNVIAVGGCDHRDRRAPKSFGECLDVLAPVEVYDSDGTMIGIATTDAGGTAGYNNDTPQPCAESMDLSSTLCFSGNSAAAPIVSGIAGLVISASAKSSLTLTPARVENLLRDTADRIDPATGGYRPIDGRSSVTNPYGGMTSTHGYGRVNAYEAVRVVAPRPLGRGGVDVFLRDNKLDWGNTEQPSSRIFGPPGSFIGHWKSVDIKVDAPPYQISPTNASQFNALVDENPIQNASNRVWVRVRNRGPVAAQTIKVRLYWTIAGAGLPPLPNTFWTDEDASSTDWHSLGVRLIDKLGYCGSSVAGTPQDFATVVGFSFQAPPTRSYYCFFAVLDAVNDPVGKQWKALGILQPDLITPLDNNVTLKNVYYRESMVGLFSSSFMLMNNPLPEPASFRLVTRAPKGWQVEIEPASVLQGWHAGPGERLDVSVRVIPIQGAHGEVELFQERLVAIQEEGQGSTEGAPQEFKWVVFGGRTFRIGAEDKD